jgi:hypothetical protein
MLTQKRTPETAALLMAPALAQGPREALAITRDLRYLRLVGRGGRQVIDLGTGNRL